MYTLSCQLCLFTRGVSHLKPKHFPSAHGTGRATNAEYFMERTSKSPDKCPHDKVTDKNKCGKIQRCIYIYIYMMYIYTHIYIYLFVSIKGAMIMMQILPWCFCQIHSTSWAFIFCIAAPAMKGYCTTGSTREKLWTRFAFRGERKEWPEIVWPQSAKTRDWFCGNKGQRTSVCWQAMPGGTVGCLTIVRCCRLLRDNLGTTWSLIAGGVYPASTGFQPC